MKNIFALENCRMELYQWDVNQRVVIEDNSINEVQFESKTFLRAIAKKVYEEDGKRYCDIPQPLLEKPDDITLYAVVVQENGGYVKVSQTIGVIGRKRPNNYFSGAVATPY